MIPNRVTLELLVRASYTNVRLNSQALKTAADWLFAKGLADLKCHVLTITDKGHAHIEALLRADLPKQTWTTFDELRNKT